MHKLSNRHLKRKQRELAGAGEATETSGEVYACPHCDFRDREFHALCPECGRPFMRDYIDWQYHPRDPDLSGTFFHNSSWARLWLIAAIIAMLVPLLLFLIYGVKLVLQLPF